MTMLADAEAPTNEKHTAMLSSKFLLLPMLGCCRVLFMYKNYCMA
jgi:hypothetical protein